MKTKLFLLTLLLPFCLFAQEPTKEEINTLIDSLQSYIKIEKDSLKQRIKDTELRLENGEITEEEAAEIKQKLSVETAQKIENNIDETIKLLNDNVKQLVENTLKGHEISRDTVEDERNAIVIRVPQEFKIKHKTKKPKKLTDGGLVFAVGINNIIENNNLENINDSPYSVWGSNFVELGWRYRTAFSRHNQVAGINYGLSFVWKELKLFDNLYHINDNGQTVITTHPQSLKKSKLRTTLITLPVFFELDYSKRPCKKDDETVYRNRGLRLGLGTYAGLKINSKQIIKYNRPRAHKKDKLKEDYNLNTLCYGLAGYIGYKGTTCYVKYDLNPLFNDTGLSNVALGIRLDF
ncbi:MAG: hypothetical protein CR968_00820 [Flavobacteriia bacterium]|nr:MAG: hypothetical protein CR968_00820 [Flavobacteriia bacterium]